MVLLWLISSDQATVVMLASVWAALKAGVPTGDVWASSDVEAHNYWFGKLSTSCLSPITSLKNI